MYYKVDLEAIDVLEALEAIDVLETTEENFHVKFIAMTIAMHLDRNGVFSEMSYEEFLDTLFESATKMFTSANLVFVDFKHLRKMVDENNDNIHKINFIRSNNGELLCCDHH